MGKIKFYGLCDYKGRDIIDSSFLEGKILNVSYPCIFLIRDNTWNDYSWVSHFKAYYFSKQKKVIFLDVVKIIRNQEDENKYNIEIDNEFNKLDGTAYFSRGCTSFYKNIKHNLPELRKDILFALNDIHFNGLTEKDFLEKGGRLYLGYKESLMRDEELFLPTEKYHVVAINMLKLLKSYLKNINEIKDAEKRKFLIFMLYGSTIATLETYLGDAFKYNVLERDEYFKKCLKLSFCKNNNKYDLINLFKEDSGIKDFVKKEVQTLLNNMSFLQLSKIAGHYKSVFDIIFLDTSNLLVAIQNRHAIFHRNGKDENDVDIKITEEELSQLTEEISLFIEDVEGKFKVLVYP